MNIPLSWSLLTRIDLLSLSKYNQKHSNSRYLWQVERFVPVQNVLQRVHHRHRHVLLWTRRETYAIRRTAAERLAHLPAAYGIHQGPLQPLEHHSSMVLRGLKRAPQWVPIIPIDVSPSDNEIARQLLTGSHRLLHVYIYIYVLKLGNLWIDWKF